MFENLSAEDYYANAIMARAASDIGAAILFVEGDSDFNILRGFVDTRKCVVIPTYGRQMALSTIVLSNDAGEKGILAIIDADYAHYENEVLPENVIVTDFNDFEILMIESACFERLMQNRCSPEKLAAFKSKGHSVKEYLLSSAAVIGRVRWASKRHRLPLYFKELDYDKFTDDATLSVDPNRVVRVVIESTIALARKKFSDRSRRGISDPLLDIAQITAAEQLKDAAILDLVATLPGTGIDPRFICNGHDTCSLIAISMTRLLGTFRVNAICREDIERDLRIAFSETDLVCTQLYKKILAWEEANRPYQIFKNSLRVAS